MSRQGPSENKHRLQTDFFQGSSSDSHKMVRPSPPSPVKMNFQRPTHYYSNRTHNPDEKMKNWFSNDNFPKGSRASSWMSTKNEEKFTPTEVSEIESSDDFWDSVFSDDFINQIMDDKFEETLIKATQEANNAKSLLSSSIVQQPKPPPSSIPPTTNYNKFKPKEKLVKSLKPNWATSQNVTIGSQRQVPVKKNLFPRQASSSFLQGSSQNTSSMSESQRKLMKPSRSFNLPSASQSLTTEWLRNQLEKVNKECSSLKESILTKDGENKILRGKLSEAKITIEKQKIDKDIECLNIKTSLEEKIKTLKKELENAKTQIMFKSKEAESNIERYKELKKVAVLEPQFSQTLSSQNFKKFINKSERLKSSFETSGANLIELSQSPRNSSTKVKDLKNTYAQTEEMTMEIAHSPKKKMHTKLILSGYEDKGMIHFGNILSYVVNPIIFETPKSEYSIVTAPIVDYNTFDILYNDISEIPDEHDRSVVHMNLLKLWNVEMNEKIRKKPKIVVKDNWKFSTLFPVHFDLLELCKLARWDIQSAHSILEQVTKMARELYVSFRVPEAVLHKRIIEREKGIREVYKDISAIGKRSNLFSPYPIGKEIYVELRRGIALIAVMCDIDPKIQKLVLEQSNFIAEENRGEYAVGVFSADELNNITCVTDSFTVELDKRTTFCHNRSSEIVSNKMEDIFNRMKNITDLKRNQERTSETEIGEKLQQMSSSMLSQLKSKLKSTEKTALEAKNVSMKIDSNLTKKEQKINRFIQVLDSKMETILKPSSDIVLDSEDKKLHTEGEDSILNQDLTDDQNCVSVISFNTEVVEKEMQKIVSESEKEILNTIFNNILQIKNCVENEDISTISPVESPIQIPELDMDINEVEVMDTDNDNAKKRKMSPEPEASTSKKRDLAPLKKLHTDENELDSQDIRNDLDDIYLEKTQVLPDSDEEEAAPLAQPATNADDITDLADSEASCDYLYPEEMATQCQLLEILLEILRCISCLRFSSRFNPLLESIVALLFSLTKINSISRQIRVQYLCTMILEILYSRPSSVVLLKVHELMAHCVCIPGFARTICHNSHPGKYMMKAREKVQFKRGACLLTMVCTLTNACIENNNWDIQYRFFNWLAYLFLVDNASLKSIYHNQKTTSGQCSCSRCLDNTIVKILGNAATSYYGFSLKKKLTPLLKLQLGEIIKQGIRILSIIFEINKFFIQNIPKRYNTFLSFVGNVHYLHLSKDIALNLAESDLEVITSLLNKKNKRTNRKNNRDKSISMSSSFSHIDLKIKSPFVSP